jgi:hypothetical protein
MESPVKVTSLASADDGYAVTTILLADHGGFSSVHENMECRVPMIVIPFTFSSW